MTFRAFTQTHLYTKQGSPKEKDKSSIQCLEYCDRNVYVGTKDSVVQHLTLASTTSGDLRRSQDRIKECRVRKLGSSRPVMQLRAQSVFNHLLVLWDHSVIALNMFSLEPITGMKTIQHVSSFEICKPSLAAESLLTGVEMVTSSSRRKLVRIHLVRVDRWEVMKEISVPQDPVALAVDGTSLCVATDNRYLLCDYKAGSSMELFPHDHNRQNVVVCSAGRGEFLLNGPGSLGMFVMKTGICQRPPLPWPEEVLAVGVCFPYTVALQPRALSVYSMLDQRLKQTVCLNGARGLCSASGDVLVFTDRDIFSLSLVPLEEQIQALVGQRREQEALSMLNGVQSQLQPESYKELHKAISCLAGLAQFNQEAFSEARDLFIEGDLDPREIINLYPDKSFLSDGFNPQLGRPAQARDLEVLREEDSTTFHRYLDFLGDFLAAVRGTEQGLKCSEEVDCALLKVYVERGDTEHIVQLVASPNACRLDYCVPVLEQHRRFFTVGMLYQSHGQQINAIKTWVKIADGLYHDTSCPDVYEHIVWTLSQLDDRDVVWMFADWALVKNPEAAVKIFTKHNPQDHDTSYTEDILSLLKKYPMALQMYLEFLINDLNSEEERHHSLLAKAYVTQALQEESDAGAMREKLQNLLWESVFYNISAVYEQIEPTPLYMEKAILLGRVGDHSLALKVLIHEEKDRCAAEDYCHRAAQNQNQGEGEGELKQTLLLTLLGLYLTSEDLTGAAVDLLNNNARVFPLETVVKLLPGSWSVQLVSRFLRSSLRETFHQRSMGGLQKGLSRAELFRHKTQASKTMVLVDKGQLCKVCQRELTQSFCSIRGELVHTGCTNSTVI